MGFRIIDHEPLGEISYPILKTSAEQQFGLEVVYSVMLLLAKRKRHDSGLMINLTGVTRENGQKSSFEKQSRNILMRRRLSICRDADARPASRTYPIAGLSQRRLASYISFCVGPCLSLAAKFWQTKTLTASGR